MSMTTKSADRTAEAKPKTPKRRKPVGVEELWQAVHDKRALTQEFANLIVELEHIGREMRVTQSNGDLPGFHAEYKRLRANSKARARIKKRMAKVAVLIARYEAQVKG